MDEVKDKETETKIKEVKSEVAEQVSAKEKVAEPEKISKDELTKFMAGVEDLLKDNFKIRTVMQNAFKVLNKASIIMSQSPVFNEAIIKEMMAATHDIGLIVYPEIRHSKAVTVCPVCFGIFSPVNDKQAMCVACAQEQLSSIVDPAGRPVSSDTNDPANVIRPNFKPQA